MALQDDNLRDFLARRFSRRPAVISFVETPAIQLSEAELPNEGSTQDLWHAVLRLTKQMDTIHQLIAEVRRQFEKDAELIDKLAEAWLKGKESAPVAINMRNPYPGLRPFEEADHDLFYGRERWIADLTKALDGFGFVTLYGGSGSGKSSLLRAGLMPRLKRAGHAVVLFTPGKNPFDSLLSMGLGNRSQAQALVEAAQKGQLPGLFTELAAKCFPGQPLLIIMDQGEELYTRCESAEVRETFLQCLFHARSQSPCILIGIREDFFDRWNKTRAHAPDFGATNLSLTPPDEGDWRAIILDPARKHGVIFQAGLPEIMIERLRVARAGLPLLQFLLQKLWEHDKPEDGVLNQESYDSLGGIDHALRGHIEGFLARFPGREGDIRQMLFKLVRFTRQDGQFRALSRSCPPQDLPNDITAAMMSDEWRILTTRGQAGEVELSHEALLRVWPGFEQLEQQRGALHALKGDITDACARWQPTRQKSELWAGSRLEESLKRSGLPGLVDDARTSDDFALAETPLSEEEREFLQTSRAQVIADGLRQKRLMRIATITAVIMLLIAATAAWFWKDANTQKNIANEQKARAKQEETRAKQLTVKAASALGSDSALEVMRTLAQNPELLQEWEGRFLAKRFGFAPMKLRRDEIGILDQGPLKGSGLYQAALNLYAGKGPIDRDKPVKSQGLTFEAMNTGLQVRLDAGDIPLLTVDAYKYGGFSHIWLSPDLSCFLGRANGLSVKSFELPHADQDIESLALDEIYLFPLLERYSCGALQTKNVESEVPRIAPNFSSLELLAGGGRHLFVHDEASEVQKRFFLRFGSMAASERNPIEIIQRPQGEPSTLTERLRLSLPKEKLAAFDDWIAEGAFVRCVDWSKEEIEVGAYFDGHFLIGPVTAPEKMKKLKLPNSPASKLWENGNDWTPSLALAFSEDGKQLLAYPFQNEQIAVINRDTMSVERVISGRKGRVFEYVESGRSWIRIGSSSKGNVVWACTGFRTDNESFVFRTGAELPVGKAGSATLIHDVDSTERYFAQSMRLSSQIILRDGFNGSPVATVSAEVNGRDDLIRESPQAAGLMLLGDTLLRTDGHSESMQMPKGIVLAPDWSWAAFLEKGSEAEVDHDGDIPYLRILRGLNGPSMALTTLADKARDYQLHWFASSAVQEQLQGMLAQTFEGREAALFKRLAWPPSLPMITLSEFEALRKNCPEIVTEADELLKERPKSPTARFIKVAASFLVTGDVNEAVRGIEADLDKSEEDWSFRELVLQWEELANYVVAKGGRLPEKLPLPNTSTLWMIIHNLRAGKPGSEEGISYLDTDDKPTMVAQMLARCHQLNMAGDKEAALQGLACIRLIGSAPPGSLPPWFTASVQSRKLVMDPAAMPLWVSLCPEALMTGLDQMFQTLPADQDIARASLKLAQTLFGHEEKREIARQLALLIQPTPGLELEAADLLIQNGAKIEVTDIHLPEGTPVETTLAWLGRLALVHYDAPRQKADAAKFAQLRAGRPLEQLTDKELRGYLCLLLANLAFDEPAGPKWDAATAVLTLLQTRQPELRDPEKLKSTSWTTDEEFAIARLLEGPKKK